MEAPISVQLGIGFWAVSAITGIGWLLSVACIFLKFDSSKDKAICLVSDLARVTFVSLTLVLSIAIILNLSFAIQLILENGQSISMRSGREDFIAELQRNLTSSEARIATLEAQIGDLQNDIQELSERANEPFAALSEDLKELHEQRDVTNETATRVIVDHLGNFEILLRYIDFRVEGIADDYQFHCGIDVSPSTLCVTNW
jgi:hypothetical protein